MISRIIILSLFLMLLVGCESKKSEPLSDDLSENILDIPVGKVGVVIYVDSLHCFNKHSSNQIIHNRLDNILSDLKNNNEIKSFVESKAVEFLKNNHYQFELLKHYDPRDFLNSTEPMNEHVNFDFKQLKSKYNYDDLLFIKVTTGLDEESNEMKNLVAKTYINIQILDLIQKNVKYTESIGGSKYIDQPLDQLTPSYAHAMISNSVVETINIIDQKFKH